MGRPTLAARAVDWRARGVVRSADLHVAVESLGQRRTRSGVLHKAQERYSYAARAAAVLRAEPKYAIDFHAAFRVEPGTHAETIPTAFSRVSGSRAVACLFPRSVRNREIRARSFS